MARQKRKKFVREYLVDFNATQAAIRAGYSAKTAKQIGQKLLTFTDVQDLLAREAQALTDQTENTPERTLEKLAGMVFAAEPTKIVTTHVGDEVSTRTEYDTLGALEKLGKYHKLFLDKLDVSHTFTFKDAENMSDAALMQLLASRNGHDDEPSHYYGP